MPVEIHKSKSNKSIKKGKKGFQAGFSGNPAGRPIGSRNKTTLAMECLLEGEAEKIMRKCVEMALDGDSVAIRLCMDRVIPTIKTRPVTFKLSIPKNSQGLLTAIDEIVAAGARGEISPDEAKIFVELIEAKCRIFEMVDLAARLENLEKCLGNSK